MFFSKKKEKEARQIVANVKHAIKNISAKLNFIEDSGAYRKREKYRMNDLEVQEKLKAFKSEMVSIAISMEIADSIISANGKLKKMFNTRLQRAVNQSNTELLNERRKELETL